MSDSKPLVAKCLAGLAATGFIGSFLVHALAMCEVSFLRGVSVAIFGFSVILLPMVIMTLDESTPKLKILNARGTFERAPKWMRVVAGCLGGYLAVGFVISKLMHAPGYEDISQGQTMSAGMAMIFTRYLMAGFWVGLTFAVGMLRPEAPTSKQLSYTLERL